VPIETTPTKKSSNTNRRAKVHKKTAVRVFEKIIRQADSGAFVWARRPRLCAAGYGRGSRALIWGDSRLILEYPQQQLMTPSYRFPLRAGGTERLSYPRFARETYGADKGTSLRFTSRRKTQNIYTHHSTPTLHQQRHQP